MKIGKVEGAEGEGEVKHEDPRTLKIEGKTAKLERHGEGRTGGRRPMI
jgi:hypothetical protein